MGSTANIIRPIALGLFAKEDRILAKKDFDSRKQETFYRIPGGGIEFGETSEQALIREVGEEFAACIDKIKFLDVLENIFTYEGRPGHEIVFVYQAAFRDKQMYDKEELVVLDKPGREVLRWFPRQDLLAANFYPHGIKRILP